MGCLARCAVWVRWGILRVVRNADMLLETSQLDFTSIYLYLPLSTVGETTKMKCFRWMFLSERKRGLLSEEKELWTELKRIFRSPKQHFVVIQVESKRKGFQKPEPDL